MITWKEACGQVGYDQSENCPYEQIVVWYAYFGGQAVKCVDQKSAKALSPNVERVVEKNPARDIWFADRRSLEMKASEIFHKALREEYSDLSDEVYSICYDEAYDDGHSSGYDEVANCMIGVTFFAAKIMKAVQK